MLKKIVDVITSKYLVYVLLLILFGILLFTCQSNKKLKNELFISNHNIVALNDSIKITKTKNGELEFSITSFIANEKDLKALNEDLYNKVKEQGGKVINLTSALLVLRQDSAFLVSKLNQTLSQLDSIRQVNDSTYVSDWSAIFDYDKKNYDKLYGRSTISILSRSPLKLSSHTDILSKESQIDLTFGQKLEGGKIHVFIQSAYPGLTAKSLNGVYIDSTTLPFNKSEKRHWFNGFSIGPSVTYGYDFSRRCFYPTIGISLIYSIYTW